MLAAKLLSGGGTETLYAEDVFSAWVRTGTGASATVTTNIDMTQGYMLWTKGRSGATDHALYHSARGVTKDLVHNTTAAETTQATGLTAVSATGHTIGALAKMNTTSATYVDWVLRNADKFYNHTTVVKSGGSNATVSFSNLTTLGMVRVKRTDSTGSWYIWHRSLTAGKLLIGETTAAEATLGHITVSGTTVTLVNGTIADGTYLVEGFAHDTGTDGIIQCGSAVGNYTEQQITLGWEPQFLMVKSVSGTSDWVMLDVSRSFSESGVEFLRANTSGAGQALGAGWYKPNATGFKNMGGQFGPSETYIYLAIRRPNKPPTTGTQVYNAIARTGTGAAATVTGVGFAPDLLISPIRNNGNYLNPFTDRLRGAGKLLGSARTDAEATDATTVTAFGMDGVSLGADSGGYTAVNQNTYTYINWFFKRAPGVFDVVCYTGTGVARTVDHGLGAVPELMIVKNRSAAGTEWALYHASQGATKFAYLNATDAFSASSVMWNDTTPTSSAFTVGIVARVNGTGNNLVAYLFATLAGISKVGSYTGTATTNAINCGFTTGARFVMIKRTDSTGDWYVWDTTRGIIAGNDPYLLLNSTAAEVTGTDYIDPSTSGFELSSTAPAAINASGGTFIYLAFA